MLWLLLCCSDKEESEVEIVHRPEDSVVEEPSIEPSSEDLDIDEDGFSVSEGDCNDWDPNVYPGATEILNYEDDDCDGLEDFDGQHSGELSMEAVGIFEGTPYSFQQSCTGNITRSKGHVTVDLHCDIDHSQEMANVLLGAVININSESDFVLEDQASTSALFVSSGGEMEWDSTGTISIMWSDLESSGGDSININVILDAIFLDIQIIGSLSRN